MKNAFLRMGRTCASLAAEGVLMTGALLCALAGSAVAKDVALHPVAVDLYVMVSDVREVPAGKPMPGLHLDAKVNGRMMDIYVAPMNFIAKYEVKVAPGDEVHIGGTQLNSGKAEVVLAREITTGVSDKKTGLFWETLTTYLRNDAGPLWE